ncbi:MAG: UDP-glucose/GDP-mannose dehydrogenase family protein [Methanobacteriaceae archaeon]|nr:UDP-glucose/GDP-mannose dehydrogenase family protein [Methanobacteriaceae archaeon]MDP2835959.1 UDP-glucose/GDP-mannose dehydrogenase family protein [Methanobacteriaceae archaeon]MDP3484550.1 UDP-glucose/GDP-mannose dehydrogenase family protein [Methanobacteriaceae archaeon]MDP3622964.1 UDP-glucose/GDP-mannose dehydrogenase family protein [Methanobacteriaceae archaeon]
MKITIIGTGYVGLVTGTCLSEMGNNVYCVDIDDKKIENLKKGIIPIYEPGLEELVVRNFEHGNLIFTNNLKEGLDNSDICFIAVGTPVGEDGSADLQYVLEAAQQIGQIMSSDLIVINKSTVPVGTADKVKDIIIKELDERKLDHNISVVSNPEFLKEGAAVDDFMKPDRVVIGCAEDKVIEILKELYTPFIRNQERFINMDVKSAEMTKYASNAMLASRISFMNEMANICERVGADINNVRIGMGSDSRIGYSFLYAGCGYGGSCFPKDIKALIRTSEDYEYDSGLLKEIEAVNENQKLVLVNKIINRFGDDLSNFTFAVWGLSFKPETDDMREASSTVIINELTNLGAKIVAYDPQAMEMAKKYYFNNNSHVKFRDNKYDVLNETDALILITEWKEFRSPDFEEIKKRIKNKIIFDGRNQFNRKILNNSGFEYFQIGNG